jgi:hypothetical protein
VAGAINLVNDTMNGRLPSQASMQKAVQPMSSEGTTVQNPQAPPDDFFYKQQFHETDMKNTTS